MTELSLTLPELGKPDKTQDPKIVTALTTIQNLINGNLDITNFPKAISTTSPAAYTPRIEVTTSSKHANPSSTRPAQVNIDFNMTAVSSFGIVGRLHVGGVIVSEFFCDEKVQGGIRIGTGFWLAPSEEWELEPNGTEAGGAKLSSLFVSYREL